MVDEFTWRPGSIASRAARGATALGGNDVVRGLAGNDVICGGAGRDVLYGGPGPKGSSTARPRPCQAVTKPSDIEGDGE